MIDRNLKLLNDIKECISKVKDYTKGGRKEFDASSMVRDAVIRNIEIIGEAVKNLPQELKDKQPQIPWKQIARIRDISIHHYFKIDWALIWGVVENDLDPLDKAIQELLK